MRRAYIDNLRSAIVLLVVLYHACLVFAGSGAVLNVQGPPLPVLDGVGLLLYPWLMPLMFLLAGMSARYALEKRTLRQFRADRVRRLLLPLLGALACFAWPLVALTFHVMGGSVGEMIAYFPKPGSALFFLALMGMGPQWFLLELFLFSMVLPVARRLDAGGRLTGLARRAGPPAWAVFWLVYWAGSAFGNLGNREALNLLMLLLGYFVFAQQEVIDRLERLAPAFIAAAAALGGAVTLYFWGVSCVAAEFLTHPLTTAYGWCACLALLSGFRRWCGGSGAASRFWRARSFAVYQFHYLAMMVTAWIVTEVRPLPAAAAFPAVLLLPVGVSLLFYEGISRIPGLRTLFALRRPS